MVPTKLNEDFISLRNQEFIENLSEQKCSEVKQCTDMGQQIRVNQDIRKERVRLFLSYRANNIQVILNNK